MLLTQDKYLNFQELTNFLKTIGSRFQAISQLESLAKSPEGRDYWLMTLTDKSKGAHSQKPALWIDANTHAGEVCGSQAALHTIDYICSEYSKKNQEICSLLERFTIYILPRISVDGAEKYLTTPHLLRSSPMPWPFSERQEGLYEQDIDGNGKILFMRIQDPDGQFKLSQQDPRLVVTKKSTDFDVPAEKSYRLFAEGLFHHYDGFTKSQKTLWQMDLNRQSPAQFHPKESGAGPVPMYLPEAKILTEAILKRPNIVSVQTHHSYGGVLLRPSSLRADSELPSFDLEMFKEIMRLGTEATGYPSYSVFHDFRYDPKNVTTGAWDDWHYDHFGRYAVTPELWSLTSQVGYVPKNPLEQYQSLPEDVLVKALHWCDQNLPKGTYFHDWKEFDHPQLGKVEIGGWDFKFVWQNPPPQFLKSEVEKITQFSLAQLKLNPQVVLREVKVTAQGEGVTKVDFVLSNLGFLPTFVSEQAKAVGSPYKPFAEVRCSEGLQLLNEKLKKEIPHLEGRSRNWPWISSVFPWGTENANEIRLSYIVKGRGSLQFTADFQMGGLIYAEAVL